MVTSTWRSIVLLAGETAVLALAVALGSYLRLQDGDWTLQADLAGMLRVLLIVVVCQMCLHYADLYDLRTIVDTRDLLVRLLQALGATSLILAVVYFWFPDWVIGRGVFLFAGDAGHLADPGLAARLHLVDEARRAARATAARRHEPGERRAGARAVRPAAGARRRNRRLHRSRSDAGRRAGHQPRRDRHDRRHPVACSSVSTSIASW